jgi:FKBP-type peptidyl-prolyl cis-trans isomerase FkpA
MLLNKNRSLDMQKLFFLLALALFAGCLDTDNPDKQREKDNEAIDKFVADKGLNMQTTTSGLRYVITAEGTGTERPAATQRVAIKYRGYRLDGTTFDQTTGDQTAIFTLSVLMQGLSESCQLLKKGGKGTFIMPSELAFGPNGGGSIGPNTVLAFDLELVDFFDATEAGQATYDQKVIKEYIAKNNLTMQQTPSGIHYSIQAEGTGANPTLQSTVSVRYIGKLLSGKIFDQTQGSATTSFALLQVIKGWQEAVVLLKKGGRGTFLIPSGLAYGPSGAGGGSIPAHAILLFEIELVDFR